MKVINFEDLLQSDLEKDALYKGGTANNLSSEPISKLLPVGNQSGIRFSGTAESPKLVALYSTFTDEDWPDNIENDILTYYGDNKEPGREIHDTPGNNMFKYLYHNLHLNRRKEVPPIFLFAKGGEGYDRIFKGLLVPGNEDYLETEDLIALWKTKVDKRFQNYKAIFTLLPTFAVKREWINDILQENKFSVNCPVEWKKWTEDK